MRKCQATENVPTPALFLKVVCLPPTRTHSISGLKSQVLTSTFSKMTVKSGLDFLFFFKFNHAALYSTKTSARKAGLKVSKK